MKYEGAKKTSVSAVEVIPDVVFAGVGNSLYVYKISDKRNFVCHQLFQKQTIHGIRVNLNNQELVCYGNRDVVVIQVNLTDFSIAVLSHFVVGDWIWDVKWRSEEMIVLCANDTVSLWRWKSKCKMKITVNRVKCLLYSGIIIGDEWSDCVIVAGTMNKTILIWAPSVGTDESCSNLHKIAAHTGAVFSLFYHQKQQKLCSTSDDRSVRIWNVCMPENCASNVERWRRASICLTITVYGHASRVWSSIMFDNGGFLTAGEDGQLRLWDENGKPLHSWITHQGASIRSVSINETENIIVTGGGDGGICSWPLPKVKYAHSTERMERIRFSNILGLTELRDIPRRIVLSRLGKVFCITNRGSLLRYDGALWRCVVNNDRFSDYCLLQISQNRQCISLASIRGDVMILRESDDGSMKVICDENICNTKIFSFHWLLKYNFITCCEQGRIEIWTLHNDNANDVFYVRKVRNFILPVCKERWLTSAIETLDAYIVGDRDGSVHLYSMFCEEIHPTRTFKRIHGRLGVSFIGDDDGRGNLFSVGRDGYIRFWRIAKNELRLLTTDRLPIKWPVQVVRTTPQGLLVAGFNEVNFEVWNIEERKKLLTFACGGGHRPWDFFLDTVIHFVFIKREIVYNLRLSRSRLDVISFSKGFHIREIECLKCLSGNTFVSGGEDTTFRVFSIEKQDQIETTAVVRSHVSSIKAISYLFVDDSALVVSVGGRAQMNIYKIHIKPTIRYEELASHMLKSCNEVRKALDFRIPALDLEPRHMDVCLHRQNDTVLIYCAGSDAFWRIFTFDINARSLELIKEIEYANFCVLKIFRLCWINENFIVTFSSDGKVTFWNAETAIRAYQHELHQSSINSYDYILPDGEQLILATGGDDAIVRLSVYKNELGRINQTDCVGGTLHEANVTGIKIISNYIISVSCDRKVILWEWGTRNYRLQQLSFTRVYHSLIPDIRGCEIVSADRSQVFICVYGVGFETLTIELEYQNCNNSSVW